MKLNKNDYLHGRVDTQEIIMLFDESVPMLVISEQTNTAQQVVRMVLKQAGRLTVHGRPVSIDYETKFRRFFNAHPNDVEKACRLFNKSVRAVLYDCEKFGIETNWEKKYSNKIGERLTDAIEEIWNEIDDVSDMRKLAFRLRINEKILEKSFHAVNKRLKSNKVLTVAGSIERIKRKRAGILDVQTCLFCGDNHSSKRCANKIKKSIKKFKKRTVDINDIIKLDMQVKDRIVG